MTQMPTLRLAPPGRSASRWPRRHGVVSVALIALGAGASLPAVAMAEPTLTGWGPGSGLGLNSTANHVSPVQIPEGPRDASATAVGQSRSLVLTPSGVLSTGYQVNPGAGAAVLGLGYGLTDDPSAARVLTPVPDTADVTAVSAGGAGVSLVLRSDGTVDGFGSNAYGEAGGAVGVARTVPTPITGLSRITQISAGNQHALALDEDGAVWAWGIATQLGNPAQTTNTGVPVSVVLPGPAKHVATGQDHSLALLRNGDVYAWGSNAFGQLGQGSTSSTIVTTPVKVTNLDDVTVTSVTGGRRFSLALLDSGKFRSWGFNGGGALGLGSGSAANVTTPANPASSAPSVPAFDQLTAGLASVYAVTADADRHVYAWGANSSGNLGGPAQYAFPYGSSNAITATSPTEVPQRVGQLKAVPWLSTGGQAQHQLVLNEPVLTLSRSRPDNAFFSQPLGTTGEVHGPQVEAYYGSATITGASIVGEHASDFRFVRPSAGSAQAWAVPDFPFTLSGTGSPGAQSFPIQFTPTGLGVRTASLRIEADGETLLVPLDGYGVPLPGNTPGETGAKGDRGEKGEKGDTVVTPPSAGGAISVSATRSSTSVRRGRTAKISLVILNGTASTVARSTIRASLPKALRASGGTRAVPALSSGGSRIVSVPVKVGRSARIGTHRVSLRLTLAGKSITRTVRLRVGR